MRLYDTARRAVAPLEPGPVVTLYSCGITPYDSAHLGHAQVYLTFDILQRRLRDLGHETRCVRNVTDVDDDILRKARELGVHYLDLAAEEIARFDADMAALGLIPAWSEPRATSAIAEILTLIGSVLDSGHAYQAGGAVYFDVTTFDRFGALSHFDPADHAGHGGRARRESRRPQQAPPARLRAVAALARRRAVVGVPLGPGPARLAHRVLGPGPARAGGDARRPRRWPGPGLPPSRVRDRPVRVGHRPAVRPSLAARRPGRAGRHQDVQVPRQPGLRGRPGEGVGAGRDPAGPARPPLPDRLGVDRRGPAAGRRPAGAWRAVAGAPGRPMPTARTGGLAGGPGRTSTTTSTRPAPSPPSTPRPPRAARWSGGRALLGVTL